LVLALAGVVAATIIALMAFNYVQVAVVQEGYSTSDPSFHQLVVSAHAFADVGGWSAIAMLGLSVLLTSIAIWQAGHWRALAVAGWCLVAILVLLFAADSSYAFLIPFSLWEIAMGAWCVWAAPKQVGFPDINRSA
jgi:hypothetical protein